MYGLPFDKCTSDCFSFCNWTWYFCFKSCFYTVSMYLLQSSYLYSMYQVWSKHLCESQFHPQSKVCSNVYVVLYETAVLWSSRMFGLIACRGYLKHDYNLSEFCNANFPKVDTSMLDFFNMSQRYNLKIDCWIDNCCQPLHKANCNSLVYKCTTNQQSWAQTFDQTAKMSQRLDITVLWHFNLFVTIIKMPIVKLMITVIN